MLIITQHDLCKLIQLELVYLSGIYKPSNQNELDRERYCKNYQKKLALHN